MKEVRSPTLLADLNRKRYLFVRSYARLIISASTKYKNLVQTHPKNFEKAFQNIMDDVMLTVKEESKWSANFSKCVRIFKVLHIYFDI
jgi:hypothetical protein